VVCNFTSAKNFRFLSDIGKWQNVFARCVFDSFNFILEIYELLYHCSCYQIAWTPWWLILRMRASTLIYETNINYEATTRYQFQIDLLSIWDCYSSERATQKCRRAVVCPPLIYDMNECNERNYKSLRSKNWKKSHKLLWYFSVLTWDILAVKSQQTLQILMKQKHSMFNVLVTIDKHQHFKYFISQTSNDGVLLERSNMGAPNLLSAQGAF